MHLTTRYSALVGQPYSPVAANQPVVTLQQGDFTQLGVEDTFTEIEIYPDRIIGVKETNERIQLNLTLSSFPDLTRMSEYDFKDNHTIRLCQLIDDNNNIDYLLRATVQGVAGGVGSSRPSMQGFANAARAGDVETLRQYINSGNFNVNGEAEKIEGSHNDMVYLKKPMRILGHAIVSRVSTPPEKREACIELLLNHGASKNIEIMNRYSKNSDTPLEYAIYDARLTKFLLEKGFGSTFKAMIKTERNQKFKDVIDLLLPKRAELVKTLAETIGKRAVARARVKITLTAAEEAKFERLLKEVLMASKIIDGFVVFNPANYVGGERPVRGQDLFGPIYRENIAIALAEEIEMYKNEKDENVIKPAFEDAINRQDTANRRNPALDRSQTDAVSSSTPSKADMDFQAEIKDYLNLRCKKKVCEKVGSQLDPNEELRLNAYKTKFANTCVMKGNELTPIEVLLKAAEEDTATVWTITPDNIVTNAQ